MDSKFRIISSEIIKDNLKKLEEEKKLSLVIKEDPKIFLMNFPVDYSGDFEIHENEDDLYIILEGEGILEIDKTPVRINKGDIIQIIKKVQHRFLNTKEGIKYLVVKINTES